MINNEFIENLDSSAHINENMNKNNSISKAWWNSDPNESFTLN